MLYIFFLLTSCLLQAVCLESSSCGFFGVCTIPPFKSSGLCETKWWLVILLAVIGLKIAACLIAVLYFLYRKFQNGRRSSRKNEEKQEEG